jgi:hypothetical protein
VAGVPSLVDTWKITQTWNVGSPAYVAEIVFHVTAPTLADPQLVANEVGAAWMVTGGPKTLQSVSAVGGPISVQPYDSATAPYVLSSPGFTGQPMVATGNAVPAQTAMIVTKRTLLSGRSYRGRIFVPAMQAALVQTDGTQWLSSSVTSFQTEIGNWKTKLEAGPTITKLVVYSYLHNTKANVSALLVRQYLGTQRRRTSA